MITRWDYY